ncbi:MAG: cytochrome-c oxidase, cbb3-type subunit III [Alphaproteobacteria bacterium]
MVALRLRRDHRPVRRILHVYPAWPGLSGYTKGIAGYSQRVEVERSIAAARAAQGGMFDRIAAAGLDEIQADPDLRAFATAGGRAAFADNCVPCHAQGGAGLPGYPSLADDVWVWCGTLQDIHYTLLHGVRVEGEGARVSQMPVFAHGILSRAEIVDVAQHVLSLTGRASDEAAAERGGSLYAANCAACHGDPGRRRPHLGAPARNDAVWICGGDLNSLILQIGRPRHGVMPAWSGRL